MLYQIVTAGIQRDGTHATLRRTGKCGLRFWHNLARLRRCDLDEEPRMKTYMCVICGYVYDEAKGVPDDGIAPGTRWEDVPLNWQCPECGAGKEDFEMMEI